MFLVVVLSLAGWGGMIIYRLFSFDPPRAYRDETFNVGREWKGEDRMTILFIGLDRREEEFAFVDSLIVTVVDPTDKSIGIFNINVDASLYYNTYGRAVSLRNVYNLGVLENDEIPVRLIMNAVERLLSIEINRYILVDEDGLPRLVDSLGGIHIQNKSGFVDEDILSSGDSFGLEEGNYRLNGEDFLSFFRVDEGGNDRKLDRQVEALNGFFRRATSYVMIFKLSSFLDNVEKNIQTDMSRWEIVRFASQLVRSNERRTSFSRSKSFLMGNEPIYDELDEDIRDVFADQRIGKEQARVEVFNATNIQGLATFRARWLRNLGIDVIRVGDTSKQFNKTTVFISNGEDYKYTVNGIEKLFEEDIEVVSGKPPFVTTGDVVVVLGDNITK